VPQSKRATQSKATNKALPYSSEAEQAFLGSILLDGRIRRILDGLISSTDFYFKGHRVIFEAMCELNDNIGQFDVISLGEQLRSSGTFEKIGGFAYLSELSDTIGTTRNIEQHAKIIREKAQLRRISEAANKIQEMALAPSSNPKEVLEKANHLLTPIDRTSAAICLNANQLLQMQFDHEIPVIGKGILPAGGGLIIAGESGVGKSMLRLELAIYLTLGRDAWDLPVPKPRSVLIFQSENTLSNEKTRLKSMLGGLQVREPLPKLLFSDPIRLDLKFKRHWKSALDTVRWSKADVVIYDPLSSFHSANENDNNEIRRVLDTLTEINRKLGTTAIVIHHFGKPHPDQHSAHRARGASSIRDWCDTMISLTHRSHEQKILRVLDFNKIRNGPAHQAILLERDENFLHHPTVPGTLCSPAQVRDILVELGGTVDGQKILLQAIKEHTGCSQRSAQDYIKQAVRMGTIKDERSKKHAQRKTYTVA
jgi:archaellum biogenesis ATPase FlaH